MNSMDHAEMIRDTICAVTKSQYGIPIEEVIMSTAENATDLAKEAYTDQVINDGDYKPVPETLFDDLEGRPTEPFMTTFLKKDEMGFFVDSLLDAIGDEPILLSVSQSTMRCIEGLQRAIEGEVDTREVQMARFQDLQRHYTYLGATLWQMVRRHEKEQDK